MVELVSWYGNESKINRRSVSFSKLIPIQKDQDCGGTPQMMKHLISCSFDCLLQELIDVSEGAKTRTLVLGQFNH